MDLRQRAAVVLSAWGPVAATSSGIPEVDSYSQANGRAGQTISIFGAHFDGTTSVDFAGKPASFAVLSSGEISAVLPSGFADGPVHVVNSEGTGTGPFFYSQEDVNMLGPATAETTDINPAAIALQAPDSEGVWRYEIRLVAQTSDKASRRSWLLTVTVRRSNVGTVTLIGDPANPLQTLDNQPPEGIDAVSDGFSNPGFSIQANVPELDVQDPTGNDVNWSAKYALIQVL